MWTPLADSETRNANFTARLLVLAIFVGLAWWVGSSARRRRHPHATLLTVLGFVFLAILVGYIVTVRPVERWSIWALAAAGFGALLIWSHGGGSAAPPPPPP